MKRRLSLSLIALYLLPWGIQCIIINFMPLYVSSLPFATEQTVGEVLGLGAVITALSQPVWASFAGKARDKSRVLALSFLLMTFFSLLFLMQGISKPLLYVLVILFYSCYMAHQPLIDTIGSECHTQTGRSFGFFRSFASLGYALMGFALSLLPDDNPSLFFLYTAVLAVASLLVSFTVSAPNTYADKSEQSRLALGTPFLRFMVYVFLLFGLNAAFNAFLSIYFTKAEHLGGSVSLFSLLLSVAAIAEWLLVMVASRVTSRIPSKLTFSLIALCGLGQTLFLCLAPTPTAAAFSFVFSALYFGILWASVAPYIRRIVPTHSNAMAQGLFTVVSSGLGGLVGSYFGGLLADVFGVRALFFMISAAQLLLAAAAPFLIVNAQRKEYISP